MIDIIRSRIDLGRNNEEKINILREFLQILILKICSFEGIFGNIAFLGGTSLRIAYGLQRYSEDLDFSLYNKKNYNFEKLAKKIKFELEKNGFDVSVRIKTGTIDNINISFNSILFDLGLSSLKDQKIMIKFEIDTNSPSGFNIEDIIINDMFMFNIKIFDINSLMSGKLHAILYRKFNKGRDWYDLYWYLSKKIKPNLLLLKNSIIQTEKEDVLNNRNWEDLLKNKINSVDFEFLKKDFEKFIINKEELGLFSKEKFLALINKSA